MIVPQYICDGCGEVKNASNHWFIVGMMDNGLAIWPGKQYDERIGGDKDFCGLACTLKYISGEMGRMA